ncbi:MAG: hypothetical protein ACRC3B_01515 [Bacteroidia bacterium]
MPTSSSNLAYTEDGLLRRLAPDEQLVFDARLLVDETLRREAEELQTAYAAITAVAREQLRAEVKAVHQQLFTGKTHAAFRNRILRLFGNS